MGDLKSKISCYGSLIVVKPGSVEKRNCSRYLSLVGTAKEMLNSGRKVFTDDSSFLKDIPGAYNVGSYTALPCETIKGRVLLAGAHFIEIGKGENIFSGCPAWTIYLFRTLDIVVDADCSIFTSGNNELLDIQGLARVRNAVCERYNYTVELNFY